MRKLFFLLQAILLLALGCGSHNSGSVYRIALDPLWYAIDVPGREINLRAFSIELLEEIAKVKRAQIAVYDRSWDNLLLGLKEKRYEGILSPMEPYQFYKNMYDFSDPYLFFGLALVLSQNSKAASLKALTDREVGFEERSSASLLLEKYPKVIQRPYPSVPALLQAIDQGVVEAAVMNALTAQAFCRDLYRGRLKVIMPPLTPEALRLVTLHEGAPGLIRIFNEGLKILQENGTYDRLLIKWRLQ